jgi:hypothetical protein
MISGRAAAARRPQSVLRFTVGFVLAVASLGVVAESFLRLFPPRDIYAFRGKASPLTGPYGADPDFTVGYASWDAFRAENGERLGEYLPLDARSDGRKLWAFFGNSFVQATGMLGDTARAALPEHRIFYLGKNESLEVRFAQVKLLLENGLRPERIFIELMPVDVLGLGPQPLATRRVTARGALTYDLPQFLEPLNGLVHQTRLGLTGCVRAGWQRGNPRFQPQRLYEGVQEPLKSDLQFLFANLARVARRHGTPVTVLLIPAYHQICCGASYGFQDQLGALFRAEGCDVFDPRAPFAAQPDKDGLFIPDRHFSARGNQILLAELLKHLEESAVPAMAAKP